VYELDRYSQPITRFGSLEELFVASTLPRGILVIGLIRATRVICRPEGRDTMSARSHAAINRAKATPWTRWP
jgi:hypothetical protein